MILLLNNFFDAIQIYMETYQMQTNLSVQTMQTSIWVIGSTSKGRGAGVEEGICKSVVIQFKGGRLIVKLFDLPFSLDVDPATQIEVCIVCTEKLVCTKYIPNLYISLICHQI